MDSPPPLEELLPQNYPTTLGDRFLNLVKKSVNNAELRHSMLAHLAKWMSSTKAYPKPSWELETHLKFQDKSVPLIMSSPIMLAAGGNKDGKNLPYFHSLGFGGLTLGSATSKPTEGNPYRPRVHLLPEDNAMINAMGLNNPGIDVIAKIVDMNLGKCHKENMGVGISVAESAGLTTYDEKIQDMLHSFRRAYRVADYVEINVSCPNTGAQRTDWHTDYLSTLLSEIMEIRTHLAPRRAVYVKLSPDLSAKGLDTILDLLNQNKVTGVVLFNTFPAERAKFLQLKTHPLPLVSQNGKKGGISGSPLYKNTLPAVKYIKKQLPHFSIIASGGVDHGSKALDLLLAGADVVQCYTVLAYRWNAIHKINKELLEAMTQKGIASMEHIHA